MALDAPWWALEAPLLILQELIIARIILLAMQIVIKEEAHVPTFGRRACKRMAEHALPLDEIGLLIALLLRVEPTSFSEMHRALNGGVHARVRLGAHWGLDSEVAIL